MRASQASLVQLLGAVVWRAGSGRASPVLVAPLLALARCPATLVRSALALSCPTALSSRLSYEVECPHDLARNQTGEQGDDACAGDEETVGRDRPSNERRDEPDENEKHERPLHAWHNSQRDQDKPKGNQHNHRGTCLRTVEEGSDGTSRPAPAKHLIGASGSGEDRVG